MWHIFTDAGVRWPDAANVQYRNAAGDWVNIFPYTPPNSPVAGTADPNSPIGVNGNSGGGANRPWPAPTTWRANTAWNIAAFPEIINTTAIRLQIYGAKTSGTSPGAGIAMLEVFEPSVPVEPVALVSIGSIIQVNNNLNRGSVLRAGPVAFDSPGTIAHTSQVAYQWYRSDSDEGPWEAIAGAAGRGSEYIITAADEGKWVRVGAGSAGEYVLGGPVYSAAVGPMPEFPKATLVSIGDARLYFGAEGLYRDSGLWAGDISFDITPLEAHLSQAAYLWQRAASPEGPWTDITGQSNRWYIITQADEGMYLRAAARSSGVNVIGGPVFTEVLGPALGQNPNKITFVPTGTLGWADFPIGNISAGLNDPSNLWNHHSSITSKHFVIFWENTGTWRTHGRPDAPGIASNMRVELNAIASEIDKIFEFHLDELGYAEPGKAYRWDTHRMIVFLRYQSAWGAWGGTSGSGATRIGSVFMQVGSSRPVTNDLTGVWQFPTFAHEIGHAVQAMMRINYPNNLNGGVNELESQNILWSYYPRWFFFESHGNNTMRQNTHRNMLHGDMIFSAPWLMEYWAHVHGRNIMGRVSRSNSGLDVFGAYMRLAGYNQTQFNDEVFEASRRFVTWDLDRIRETNANWANRMISAYHSGGDGVYRAVANRAPNNYGFNAFRMQVPAAGTEITVDFMGRPDLIAASGSFYGITNNNRVSSAGWRYGFVALTGSPATAGNRIYSPMYSASFAEPNSSAKFTVPENTTHLWMVVTGAPSQHWSGVNATNGNDFWGYHFRLSGTSAFTVANNSSTVGGAIITRDNAPIDAAIAEARTLVEAGYCPAKWQPVQTALAFAAAERARAAATYVELGVAINRLNNAVAALTGCSHKTVYVDAVCLEGGSVTTTCEYCDYMDAVIIPALGHSIGGQIHAIQGNIYKGTVYCQREGCDHSEEADLPEITDIKVEAGVTETVERGGVYNFNVLLNEGAYDYHIVWTVSDPSFVIIDGEGNIYILNKTGTIRLIATDPVSGRSHSITLRIAS